MGTVAEIAVVESDERRAQAALDAAFDELFAVERAMTRFTATSDVGRANAGAAREAVPVSDATVQVLREALAWAESSDGAFDPCIGRAIELWDVAHRSAPPPEREVRRLAGRAFYRHLDLDTWRGRPVVRFGEPDMALDLGGIACGYGVDRAVAALRRMGIRHGLVNVGGDLYALGRSPEGDPWQVGIQSPRDPRVVIEQLPLEDAAVTTSGDYMQYFDHAGRRYHHLLDPATGEPRVTLVHSVTVRAPTCLEADVAATAVFGLAAAEARRVLRARGTGAELLRTL
jgi:thiamine biosynthesis lipoprotein